MSFIKWRNSIVNTDKFATIRPHREVLGYNKCGWGVSAFNEKGEEVFGFDTFATEEEADALIEKLKIMLDKT